MSRFGVAAGVFLFLGCGVDSVAEFGDEVGDDEVELVSAELNASQLLGFVNGASATYTVLTASVGLDARAAKGIVTTRDGADGTFGTADDRPFASIASLDTVPYVGASALAKLDQYAAGGGAGAVIVEGVIFPAAVAVSALAAVNGPGLPRIGLSATVAQSLAAARPFSSLQQVASVPSVGASALSALKRWAEAHPTLPGSTASCASTGGTFDAVSFTAAEDCRALDFPNTARLSDMAALPSSARTAAFNAPFDTSGFRQRTWTSVEAFSRLAGIGTTAMNGLKQASASWTQRGLGYDTVSNTWANRAALVGAPLGLWNAYVTKVLPERSLGGYRMQCAELRDSPTASNWIVGCYPALWCSQYGTEPCWPRGANTWVSVYGSWRTSSEPGFGGYLAYLTGSAGVPNAVFPH